MAYSTQTFCIKVQEQPKKLKRLAVSVLLEKVLAPKQLACTAPTADKGMVLLGGSQYLASVL